MKIKPKYLFKAEWGLKGEGASTWWTSQGCWGVSQQLKRVKLNLGRGLNHHKVIKNTAKLK